MKKLILLVGLIGVQYGSVTADELYRWVDESGSVHYSDLPAIGMPGVKKRKMDSSAEDPDAGLSYETRRTKKNFPVTLYVAENCAEICQEARILLRNRGVPFDEKILKTAEDFSAFKQASGSTGVPTLMVGKVWLKGFQVGQWNDELDAAGYVDAASPSR